MMPGMKYRLFPVCLLLMLTGCAPEPLVRSEDSATGPVDQIAVLIEQQRYESALAALQDGLEREQDPSERARLRLDAAELLLAAGQTQAARSALQTLHDGLFGRADRARLALARAELALLEGDAVNAGWLLAQVREDVPSQLTARLEALEALLRRSDENPAREALQSLERSLVQGDFEPELALALLIEFPVATLEALDATHGGQAALAPWLDLAQTARRFVLDNEQLPAALATWQQRHPAAGYSAAAAEEWLIAWRQLQKQPMRIAALLPSPDSSLARPGGALRDGLISAWSRQPENQRHELLFFYLDDTPGAAVDAWFSARAAGAELILGPLVRDQVDALLDLRDVSVPVLLLNQPSERHLLSNFPGLAHAFALTPDEEAEIVAARALVDGHRRALVLRQDSDWGDRVARTFAETFALGGGRIVRDMRYSPNQVDHSILLEVLLGLDRSRERSNALQRLIGAPLMSEPAPRTDADMIFLASRAEDARAIRPQLKFFGAEAMPVLATSHVLAGAPNPRRDHDLEQVLLPLAPWFLDSSESGLWRQHAETLYPGLDNPTLSRLFALGADSLALLPWLNFMRSDPALQMASLTGRLRLDNDGMVERDLPFIRLVDGRPVLQ